MKTNRFFKGWTIFVVFFMLAPFAVIVYSSFSNSMNITIPLTDPGVNAYRSIFLEGKYLKSLGLSLEIAVWSTLAAVVLGTLVSFAITRYAHMRVVRFVNQTLASVLMIPAVIIGVSMLATWSNMGMLFNKTVVIVAHTVMTIPYVLRTVTASLSSFNYSLEDASLVLGARPMRTLVEVSLPCIRPGLITGGIFAFIGSFGDCIVTSFILPIGMKTLPIEIMNTLTFNLSTDISAISTLVSIAIFGVLYLAFRMFPDAFLQQ